MKIHGEPNILSYPDNLQPLFEAMKEGKIIKSITCMAGSVNEDDRSKDFVIEGFLATDYWQGQMTDGLSKWFDYVDGDTDTLHRGFYMNWVLSFTL